MTENPKPYSPREGDIVDKAFDQAMKLARKASQCSVEPGVTEKL
jgi:hypothetical protein